MKLSFLQHVICWTLIALTPASLLAADADLGGAMLYGRGKEPVLLNGQPLPRSSAVFPGDLIQTPSESVATLDAPGSGIIVYPDSMVKFEPNSLSLQHGSISIGTSKRMAATALDVTATPTADAWTEFEVADINGSIRVTASNGSVEVTCAKGNFSLSEGDEMTRDEAGNCRKRKRKGGALLPGSSGTLSSPWVVIGAAGTVGGVLCMLLCDNPQPFISQWKP
jgi:hypothetical protein